MAKNKKTATEETPSFEFEYRLLPNYRRLKSHSEWKGCSEDGKAKIERMFPKMYEFREIKPPTPTPNAIIED